MTTISQAFSSPSPPLGLYSGACDLNFPLLPEESGSVIAEGQLSSPSARSLAFLRVISRLYPPPHTHIHTPREPRSHSPLPGGRGWHAAARRAGAWRGSDGGLAPIRTDPTPARAGPTGRRWLALPPPPPRSGLGRVQSHSRWRRRDSHSFPGPSEVLGGGGWGMMNRWLISPGWAD